VTRKLAQDFVVAIRVVVVVVIIIIIFLVQLRQLFFNPLECKGNNATSNNMKLVPVHWPLICGLLHLAQRGGDSARPQPAQSLPRSTKCNSAPVNGQCTNHRSLLCGFNVPIYRLIPNIHLYSPYNGSTAEKIYNKKIEQLN